MDDKTSQAPETFNRFNPSHEAHDQRHFERHGTHIPPLSADDGATPAEKAPKRKRGSAAPKAEAPAAKAAEAVAPAAASPDAAAAAAEPVVEAAAAKVEGAAAAEKGPKRTRELKPRMPGAKKAEAAAAASGTSKAKSGKGAKRAR